MSKKRNENSFWNNGTDSELIARFICSISAWMQWETFWCRTMFLILSNSFSVISACVRFAFMICAIPVPAFCWQTACRWNRFRSGWDTAIFPQPPIFIPIWITPPRFPPQKPWWMALEWTNIREMRKILSRISQPFSEQLERVELDGNQGFDLTQKNGTAPRKRTLYRNWRSRWESNPRTSHEA